MEEISHPAKMNSALPDQQQITINFRIDPTNINYFSGRRLHVPMAHDFRMLGRACDPIYEHPTKSTKTR